MTDRHFEHDLEQIRDRVPIAELIGRDVELKARGRELVGLCPFHAEKTGSFTVAPDKGFFHCFGCGAHGDQFGFLVQHFGIRFLDAVEELAREAGLADGRRRLPRRSAPAPKREQPRRTPDPGRRYVDMILEGCRPAEASPVETYLRARGIDLEAIGGIPPHLLYHPKLKHTETGMVFPAMVARVIGSNGKVWGLHRTYLEPDGSGKAPVASAKMMLDQCYGGAVPLGPVPTATRILAEGIETGLACLQIARLAGLEDQVLAALSLGNIAGGGLGQGKRRRRDDPRYERKVRATWNLPSTKPDPARPGLLLRHATDLVIAAERGNKDEPAYRALLERAGAKYRAHGLRVRFAWPQGGDFNDDLQEAVNADCG